MIPNQHLESLVFDWMLLSYEHFGLVRGTSIEISHLFYSHTSLVQIDKDRKLNIGKAPKSSIGTPSRYPDRPTPFPLQALSIMSQFLRFKAYSLHRPFVAFTAFSYRTVVGGQERPGLAPFSKRLMSTGGPGPYHLQCSGFDSTHGCLTYNRNVTAKKVPETRKLVATISQAGLNP